LSINQSITRVFSKRGQPKRTFTLKTTSGGYPTSQRKG
jgi:hypothetical protein